MVGMCKQVVEAMNMDDVKHMMDALNSTLPDDVKINLGANAFNSCIENRDKENVFYQ